MLDNPFEPKTQLDTLKPTLYISKLEEKRNVKTDEKIVKDTLVAQTSEKEVNKEEQIKIFTGDVVESDTTSNKNSNDYSKFIFGTSDTNKEKVYANDSLFIPKNNLDENGNYLVNKYKITFGPDLVYANAGYSTFYGLIGTTVLSFSDVLGDHRLIGVTGLQSVLQP